MNKKVLVLGAVSCVAGIVTATAAGCSSSETVTNPPPDASSDVRSERTPIEAGEEDAATCLVDPEVTPATFEQTPGYKPGAIKPGLCSTTELSQFEKNLDDTNIKTWKDLGNDIGTTCAECIITSKEAATWGPVVYTDDAGERGFYNFGACFGAVEKESCGKAVQFLEWCLDAACDACTTQGDRDTCIESAADTSGVCGSFVDTLTAECKNLTTSGKKCNNILDAAKTLCGPPTGDGGLDGGDAGDADAN
jgi:hypothetical protein